MTAGHLDHAGTATVAVDMRALVGAPSGIGYFTLSMLRALGALGDWRILGMAHRGLDPEARDGLAIDFESHGGPFGVWWQQFLLPRRLAAGDIELLWSPNTILPNRLPVPGVVTIHDLTVLTHPTTHRWKVRASIVPFLGQTIRQAHRIAVDSRATADDLCSRYPDCSERVEVVYPGVDDEFRPAGATEIQRIREKLGCPEGYVLYAGTIEPRKNIGALLSAWEIHQSSGGRLPLIVAGPYGWRSRGLTQRIDALQGDGLLRQGRVDRAELVRLMQAARVFVYPSLYEGFGLPPAEAMACGVPTITSDRSSLPEIVGEAGIMVDPEQPAELAAAIDRIVSDDGLASALAAAGPERVGRFSWPNAARSMSRIFTRALG